MVEVEVGNHRAKVTFFKFAVPVFSQELAEGGFLDEAHVLTVNPFESSKGFEVAHGAELLAHLFDAALHLGSENKDVLELLFGGLAEDPNQLAGRLTYLTLSLIHI